MTASPSAGRPCFTIGGLTLRLADAPDIIARSLDKAFSLSRTPDAAGGVTMTAELLDDGAFTGAMPAFVREAHDRLPEGEEPLALAGPGGEFCVIVRSGGTASYALVDRTAETLHLSCQRLSASRAPLHFQSVLIPAMKHLLLRRGKLLLHAGCVATEDGRGLLFAGLSGAGKTTTCIALAQAGFRYVSDDLVVLSLADGRPVVEGIREHMNLTARTIGFFPGLAKYAAGLDRSSGAKVAVNPLEVFGADRVSDRAVIDSIMVIVIGREGPRLEPVNPPSVLSVVLQNHTFETGLSIPRESMDILWGILGAVRTFRLLTGPDPGRMGEHVYGAVHGKEPPQPAAGRRSQRDPGRARGPLTGTDAASLLRQVLGHTLDGLPGPATLPAGNGAVRLFRHHRLEAHLARWAKDAGIGDRMDGLDPDRVLTNAAALALKRDRVTLQVHGGLQDAGIPSLLLRGPAMAKRFYPDETLRTYRDIDLIIPRERLLQAAEALRALGYRPDRDLAYWEKRGEWPFTGNDAIVELHWEAYPAPFPSAAGLGAEDVRREQDSITIEGKSIGCLSLDHLLLSSILHAVYDHRLDRLVRLIDVRQIMKLGEGRFNDAWIAEQVRRTGTAVAVRKALSCLAAVLPAPVPGSLAMDLQAPRLPALFADLVLPDSQVIAGRGPFDAARRWAFLQTLRFRS